MKIITVAVSLLLFACYNVKSKNRNSNFIASSEIEPMSIQKNIYSGVYNDISIAVKGKSVTGCYEYYDNWSQKDKEFLNINVFYFSGEFINDSVVAINTVCPGFSQKLTGTMIFRTNGIQSLRITLSDQPFGYNDVDFTQKEGIEIKQSEKKNWSEIRYIKTEKAPLFDKPDYQNIRKAYLVKNDFVKVLQKTDSGFVEVEYRSPLTEKTSIYWIKEIDLN